MKWLSALLLVPLAFFIGIWLQKPPVLSRPASQVVVSPTPLKTNLDADKLWSLINTWRESKKLSPFIKDQRLCVMAESRLFEIRADFSHSNFKNHWTDIKYVDLGENLAKDHFNNQFLLDSWLDSPSHFKNLAYNYKYSCIVTSYDGYAVQIFANF